METELAKTNYVLVTTATTPISSGYRPELDISHLLDDAQANWFQNLIGVL